MDGTLPQGSKTVNKKGGEIHSEQVDICVMPTSSISACSTQGELANRLILTQSAWGGAWGSAFLTSSQVMLMLLVQQKYFEYQGSVYAALGTEWAPNSICQVELNCKRSWGGGQESLTKNKE